MASATGKASRPVLRGWLKLAVAVGAMAAVWLVALPWVAARPAVEARRAWLEEQGIDPAAMFYTELPMMDRVLERLEGPLPSEGERGRCGNAPLTAKNNSRNR